METINKIDFHYILNTQSWLKQQQQQQQEQNDSLSHSGRMQLHSPFSKTAAEAAGLLWCIFIRIYVLYRVLNASSAHTHKSDELEHHVGNCGERRERFGGTAG